MLAVVSITPEVNLSHEIELVTCFAFVFLTGSWLILTILGVEESHWSLRAFLREGGRVFAKWPMRIVLVIYALAMSYVTLRITLFYR